jgi:hypothetical protein
MYEIRWLNRYWLSRDCWDFGWSFFVVKYLMDFDLNWIINDWYYIELLIKNCCYLNNDWYIIVDCDYISIDTRWADW